MSYPVLKGILQSSVSYTWNTADNLGRGATAIVYLGRQKNDGSVVAVKVFHEHIQLHQGGDELRELELLQRFRHENIIRLFSIEKELQTQRVVLIMQYCEGGSLYHMLDQPQYTYGLDEPEFLLALKHVAAGIEYLRRLGIIHRDIKPGNIMRFITEDGRSIYKLTDFGAARELQEEENFFSLYGTEEYLHPGMYERAVLRLPTGQSFNSKVDLWSLGVTFYHIATGKLPFQPYGGRNNKETMFRIISEKQSGIISGIQNFENGPITFSRELPQTCPLSSGMKALLIPLLAGLMESDDSRVLTYESFFRIVQTISQKITLNIFHFSGCCDLKIYIDRNVTYSTLQDIIASQTDIQAADQMLLVSGKPLDQMIDVTAEIRSLPTSIIRSRIYLFQQDLRFLETQKVIHPEIPIIPEITSYIDMDKDARLAQNCCARGHLKKRYVEETIHKQELLVEGEICFRTYIHARLKDSGDSFVTMTQLLNESKKRFNAFYYWLKTIKTLCDRFGYRDKMLTDVFEDKTLLTVHQKAEERTHEILRYRSALVEKLDENNASHSQWYAPCKDNDCLSKINHQLSVMASVQSRFRRDKNVKEQMTSHDEHVHQCERQKLQDYYVKMSSILQDHCFKNLELMYKEGMGYLNTLSKNFIRITKIEKNIESVLDCQQLLSSKLDRTEEKCKGLMNRICTWADQHAGNAAKSGSDSSADTGYAGSSSIPEKTGANYMPPVAGAFPSGNFSNDLKTLMEESMTIHDLVEENTEIIKKLEEIGLHSHGSLSRKLTQT